MGKTSVGVEHNTHKVLRGHAAAGPATPARGCGPLRIDGHRRRQPEKA